MRELSTLEKLGHFKATGQVVGGVSPDQPIVENERGGKQSASPYRCDLLPAKAMLEAAKVLKYGADRYGDNNWRNIDVSDHIQHILAHLFAHLAGDTSDDHLSHALVRAMFAVELDIEKE